MYFLFIFAAFVLKKEKENNFENKQIRFKIFFKKLSEIKFGGQRQCTILKKKKLKFTAVAFASQK